MRHIIIASHYGLAAGLGDTLKAIIGPGHDIRVVCAFTDETPLEENLPVALELSLHAGQLTPDVVRHVVTQAKEQLVYLGDLTPDVDEEDE